MKTAKLPRLIYGADYNPEQWPESVWREDAALMREAGVNMVSLGIFAWSKLEPRPGQYDFAWLDRVMDLLHAHGVQVNLATATASPPPWFSRRHPDSLPVTREGQRLWPGARQHYCPSHSAYRAAAAALVTQLATRYKGHPALAMWHVGNEYGCHVAECYCETSAAAFRAWLQRRYHSVEQLNDAWGTSFWSQRYSAWDEIEPPRSAPTFINPGQQLDWKRFCSDALLECFELERDILTRLTPQVPITTNFVGIQKALDGWAWAAREDVVAVDTYPDPASEAAHIDMAMQCDLTRSLGEGKPWVLMEQTPSLVQWRQRNALKHPGQMRAMSFQALARGARGVMFFQWRQSRAGAEKFHGAMVPHAGPDSRVWREVRDLGQEFRSLPALPPVQAEVAIVFDWPSWWALELDAKPSGDLRLLEQVQAHYAALYRRNIAVDFARPGADLSRYKLVVVPNLYLVEPAAAQNLEGYVRGGGTLLMSLFSGIVDGREQLYLDADPAPFRALLGLRVEEYDPYPVGHTNTAVGPDGQAFACDLWSDLITLEGAQALACYTHDFYAGRAAITRHAFGQGVSYYAGTRLGSAGLDWLVGQACDAAGVRPPLDVPAGVEVTCRAGDERAYWFLINHTGEAVQLDLPAVRDLRGLNGEALSAGPRRLLGYGVLMFTSERQASTAASDLMGVASALKGQA